METHRKEEESAQKSARKGDPDTANNGADGGTTKAGGRGIIQKKQLK